MIWDSWDSSNEFQSTRPVRGATLAAYYFGIVQADFNPRAPCGARRAVATVDDHRSAISIHAPRAGRDYQKYA